MKDWQELILLTGTGGGSLAVLLGQVEAVLATLTVALTFIIAVWRFYVMIRGKKTKNKKDKNAK